jgi:hypothetical protein
MVCVPKTKQIIKLKLDKMLQNGSIMFQFPILTTLVCSNNIYYNANPNIFAHVLVEVKSF